MKKYIRKSVPELKAGDIVPFHGGLFRIADDAVPVTHPVAGVHTALGVCIELGDFPPLYLQVVDGKIGFMFQGNHLATKYVEVE